MGLDVYLYPKNDHELNTAYWAAWEAEYESFAAMTPEHRAAWDTAHPQAERADVKSTAYPEHMFNRRYLRSSYNGGGFNRAVPEMTGTDHDLYWIFEPVRTGEESPDLTTEHLPALRKCRDRAVQVVAELRACDRLRVMTLEPNTFLPPALLDEEGALHAYREHVAKRQNAAAEEMRGSSYSSREGDLIGDYFPGGFEILGAYAAVRKGWREAVPCTFVVFRTADEGFDYYVQAAEITIEFCDETVALVERDGGAHMSWSG